MSGNSTNFNNKKIKISDFYKNKNTKIFNMDEIDVNKILVSSNTAQRENLNTLLYILIMKLLNHYI